MPFIANTAQQQEQMLGEIGLSINDLFADIPSELMRENFNLPGQVSEMEVLKRLADLAGKNSTQLTCFLGGGFYDHFIPSAVYSIISRSEFYTAYTPYQPELSQGTLQAIYEYQSMICRLCGMEASNASLYDGGTALYEAMMMALRITGRNKIIIDDSVNPIYRVMIHSYTQNLNIELDQTNCSNGLANRAKILDLLDEHTGAVIVQNPNFFGCIDDFTEISDLNRKQREGEIQKAMEIIASELGKFVSWWRALEVRPIDSALVRKAEDIRRTQLNKTLKKLRPLSDAERDSLEAMTKSIVTKILKDPIYCVKANASNNRDYAEMVSELFQLNRQKPE